MRDAYDPVSVAQLEFHESEWVQWHWRWCLDTQFCLQWLGGSNYSQDSSNDATLHSLIRNLTLLGTSLLLLCNAFCYI